MGYFDKTEKITLRGAAPGRWCLVALGLFLAAGFALSVDCPLAVWCLEKKCPRIVHDLLEVCTVFGNGMGALLIVLAIQQFEAKRRRVLCWVLACALLSGLAADCLKLTIARTRPQGFQAADTIISMPAEVSMTFGGWLPGAHTESVYQSFPSGHTATATGLALALLSIYPQGRRLFPILAMLVGCHRVECGAHFLSDVLCGAALGCLVTAGCVWASQRLSIS
ncbi:MAG: phosphatase PAP2 family protein [Thermoguttaceae bacterium]|jgi:undecaprenyl-diphosphatase